MSSATSIMKFPTLVCELIDQQNSGYLKDESAGTGVPEYLSAPASLYLPINSVVMDDKSNLRKIRYMRASNTIDLEEQKKQGNEDHNPMTDYIEFKNGVLSVTRQGADIPLYDYLSACAYNADVPDEKRPNGIKPFFRVLKAALIAETNIEDLDEKVKALQLLSGLKQKTAKGYEYDTDAINALCTLFNLSGDSEAEKLQSLISVANTRPDFFNESIGSATKSIEINIAEASDFGVTAIEGDAISFTATNRVFLKFKSKSKDKRQEELISHFISAGGETDYKELVLKLDGAKTALLATKE